MVYIRDLTQLWRVLSEIHTAVNSHPANLDKLDRAISRYRLAIGTFEFEGAPKPCSMKRRLNKHAISEHLSDEMHELNKRSLHLSLLQSRYLEANNKGAQGSQQILPAGGLNAINPELFSERLLQLGPTERKCSGKLQQR
jgi:hypothetical protein